MEQAARANDVEKAAAAAEAAGIRSIGLWPRIMAYLVDSVILLAVQLVFFIIAGAQLLAWGTDPPDSAYYTFFAILMAGILGWSALNIALLVWRGQSAGQYVAGQQVVAEDAGSPTLPALLIRWFALNPLLFHPLLAGSWFVFGAIVFTLTLNLVALVVASTMFILCLVAGPLALVSALLSRRRRALHDMVSGTTVVRAP